MPESPRIHWQPQAWRPIWRPGRHMGLEPHGIVDPQPLWKGPGLLEIPPHSVVVNMMIQPTEVSFGTFVNYATFWNITTSYGEIAGLY